MVRSLPPFNRVESSAQMQCRNPEFSEARDALTSAMLEYSQQAHGAAVPSFFICAECQQLLGSC